MSRHCWHPPKVCGHPAGHRRQAAPPRRGAMLPNLLAAHVQGKASVPATLDSFRQFFQRLISCTHTHTHTHKHTHTHTKKKHTHLQTHTSTHISHTHTPHTQAHAHTHTTPHQTKPPPDICMHNTHMHSDLLLRFFSLSVFCPQTQTQKQTHIHTHTHLQGQALNVQTTLAHFQKQAHPQSIFSCTQAKK
jgi:hypothetical protein